MKFTTFIETLLNYWTNYYFWTTILQVNCLYRRKLIPNYYYYTSLRSHGSSDLDMYIQLARVMCLPPTPHTHKHIYYTNVHYNIQTNVLVSGICIKKLHVIHVCWYSQRILFVSTYFLTAADKRVFPLCTQFKAIYPFDAILPEELTLKPGDIVEAAEGEFDSKPKWAKGRIQHTDKEGLFYTDFMAPCLPKKGSRERKAPGYESAYAGNDVILDSKPEEWFECLICKEHAYDPHQTACCGHTLCLKCAVQWN